MQALCPILSRQDDFGDGATKYPLFWVKYDDVAPFLAKQTIMTSNLNNAATMSVDDYFTMNKYSGKIYKTNNMLGQTLAQMAVAWILAKQAVTSVIVGSRTVEQLADSIGAVHNSSFTAEELLEINQILL